MEERKEGEGRYVAEEGEEEESRAGGMIMREERKQDNGEFQKGINILLLMRCWPMALGYG